MSLGLIISQYLIPNQYPHPIADAYLKQLQDDEKKTQAKPKEVSNQAVFDVADLEQQENVSAPPVEAAPAPPEPVKPPTPAEDISQVDTPDVPMRAVEKKRLSWNGMTCISPSLYRCDLT